jgi:hypothetical protein
MQKSTDTPEKDDQTGNYPKVSMPDIKLLFQDFSLSQAGEERELPLP